MTDLPVVIGPSGPVPQTLDSLRTQMIAIATAEAPGLTTDLPGALIEDISSTQVAGLALIDQARVDAINSLTPYGSNEYTTGQLGAVYGVAPGQESNTSVFVVFSGAPGYVIAKGFTVTDGTYQYVVQDGGIIASGGTTSPLFAVATVSGSWAVPENTVTQFVTSVPVGVSLTVTNPQDGIPSTAAQTPGEYRADVLQAGLAVAQGMPTMLKTQLRNVSGVQSRLVAARAQTGGGWEIIVGGGDPYEVANAIFMGLFDVSSLVGSVIHVTAASKAAAAVITTDLYHGYHTGESVTISGAVGMTGINGVWSVTVLSQTTFSIPYDSSSAPTYTGGGVCSPNPRNVTVSIQDYPDTYSIPYVSPPQQAVTMNVTWNTTATNVVSPAAVAQIATPALVNYVNSVAVGVPMNLFVLQTTFQQAVVSLIDPQFLTTLEFQVFINAVEVDPEVGTGIIAGDPESYFLAAASGIVISQG